MTFTYVMCVRVLGDKTCSLDLEIAIAKGFENSRSAFYHKPKM